MYLKRNFEFLKLLPLPLNIIYRYLKIELRIKIFIRVQNIYSIKFILPNFFLESKDKIIHGILLSNSYIIHLSKQGVLTNNIYLKLNDKLILFICFTKIINLSKLFTLNNYIFFS